VKIQKSASHPAAKGATSWEDNPPLPRRGWRPLLAHQPAALQDGPGCRVDKAHKEAQEGLSARRDVATPREETPR
jgi:hypothetical protein